MNELILSVHVHMPFIAVSLSSSVSAARSYILHRSSTWFPFLQWRESRQHNSFKIQIRHQHWEHQPFSSSSKPPVSPKPCFSAAQVLNDLEEKRKKSTPKFVSRFYHIFVCRIWILNSKSLVKSQPKNKWMCCSFVSFHCWLFFHVWYD